MPNKWRCCCVGLQIRLRLNATACLARTVPWSRCLPEPFRSWSRYSSIIGRVICSLAVILKLWLDHVDGRRKTIQVYVNLKGCKLDLDILDASMALHGCCSLSSATHPRLKLGRVFDPYTSEDMFWDSRRALHKTAKRVRLSCSLKSRVFSSISMCSTLACPPHTPSSPIFTSGHQS